MSRVGGSNKASLQSLTSPLSGFLSKMYSGLRPAPQAPAPRPVSQAPQVSIEDQMAQDVSSWRSRYAPQIWRTMGAMQ